MKGLLMKDFCLMKEMGKFLGVIIVISIFLLVTGKGENIYFVMGYVCVLCSFLVMNTISYDEMEKGYSFLMTLPVSRKEYVLEKYGFGIITGFIGTLLGMIITTAYIAVMKISYPLDELAVSGMLFCCIFLLVDIVVIPIQLKYGAEKGRFVIIGCIMFGALAAYLLDKIADVAGMDLAASFEWFVMQSWSKFVLGAVILVLVVISYLISSRIMKKKEL